MRDRIGSSPLARGLPPRGRNDPVAEGIIPARAGFTPLRVTRMGSCADHPRSRGVYRVTPTASATDRGSSPLARGLPLRHRLTTSRSRIIPARAGFTQGPWVTGRASPDHPRSRGVYTCACACARVCFGSSPLARGLRVVCVLVLVVCGIIPARAGFTALTPASQPLCRDHPRSRGVYTRGLMRRPSSGGSSPLARGLP